MWIEKIVGNRGDRQRWREHEARIARLPLAYREAAQALQRYLLHLGPVDDPASLLAMTDDLADLLEQSAAAGTPVRDVVGGDPVEFAEAFMANYGGGSWIRAERDRLAEGIDRAVAAGG